MKTEFNEKLKDNRKKDLWQAVGEQDIITLRSQLGNIRRLSETRIKNHNMPNFRHERK